MIDTNVMISGLLFPNSQMNAVVLNIMNRHKLVISSYVLEEFKDVVRRKFPRFIVQMDEMLGKMSYELVYTPDTMEQGSFSIRDQYGTRRTMREALKVIRRQVKANFRKSPRAKTNGLCIQRSHHMTRTNYRCHLLYIGHALWRCYSRPDRV